MNDQNFMLQLVSLDGLHSGVPTRTTPTLTPTTLRSIEQTFLELTSESASHSREAGFVPPLVEPSQPTPAQTQNTTAHHTIITTAGPVAANTTLVESHQTQPQQPTRRNMGGRRPTRTIGMSPEEEERRQIRRERNKMAAARCRKRRMDHTNALLEVSRRNLVRAKDFHRSRSSKGPHHLFYRSTSRNVVPTLLRRSGGRESVHDLGDSADQSNSKVHGPFPHSASVATVPSTQIHRASRV